MSGSGNNYRERLYQHYVSKHLATFRDISFGSFEKQRKVYRHWFGKFLPPDKRARILDVGCGYGTFLYFLEKEGYTNCTGVDASAEQLALARKMGVANVVQADAFEFLFQHPNEFDSITAFDVLEHYPKDEVLTFLDATCRALKDGGRFLCKTVNGNSPYASWNRYNDFTHESAFSPNSITQVLGVTGFSDIRVFALDPFPHSIASAGRWMLWKLIKQMIRFYLLVEEGYPGSGIVTSNLGASAIKRFPRLARELKASDPGG